jgi:hypothetical protein
METEDFGSVSNWRCRVKCVKGVVRRRAEPWPDPAAGVDQVC